MKEIILIVMLGQLTVTSYRSVKNQTDDSPFHTSTGERVSPHGVAVSQDLICPACLKLHRRCDHPENPNWVHYGDCLFSPDFGFKIINDVMGRYKTQYVKTKEGIKKIRYKQDKWIDIWVPSQEAEQKFHSTYGIRKHKIWLVRENYSNTRKQYEK